MHTNPDRRILGSSCKCVVPFRNTCHIKVWNPSWMLASGPDVNQTAEGMAFRVQVQSNPTPMFTVPLQLFLFTYSSLKLNVYMISCMCGERNVRPMKHKLPCCWSENKAGFLNSQRETLFGDLRFSSDSSHCVGFRSGSQTQPMSLYLLKTLPSPHPLDDEGRKAPWLQVKVRNRINNSSNLMRSLLGLEK